MGDFISALSESFYSIFDMCKIKQIIIALMVIPFFIIISSSPFIVHFYEKEIQKNMFAHGDVSLLTCQGDTWMFLSSFFIAIFIITFPILYLLAKNFMKQYLIKIILYWVILLTLASITGANGICKFIELKGSYPYTGYYSRNGLLSQAKIYPWNKVSLAEVHISKELPDRGHNDCTYYIKYKILLKDNNILKYEDFYSDKESINEFLYSETDSMIKYLYFNNVRIKIIKKGYQQEENALKYFINPDYGKKDESFKSSQKEFKEFDTLVNQNDNSIIELYNTCNKALEEKNSVFMRQYMQNIYNDKNSCIEVINGVLSKYKAANPGNFGMKYKQACIEYCNTLKQLITHWTNYDYDYSYDYDIDSYKKILIEAKQWQKRKNEILKAKATILK